MSYKFGADVSCTKCGESITEREVEINAATNAGKSWRCGCGEGGACFLVATAKERKQSVKRRARFLKGRDRKALIAAEVESRAKGGR